MNQADQKRQMLMEIQDNEREIEYRDQMATKIVGELQIIGEMMRDLDNIAKSQQTMLDCIEANIDQVDEHTSGAVVELREASANQKSCIIS